MTGGIKGLLKYQWYKCNSIPVYNNLGDIFGSLGYNIDNIEQGKKHEWPNRKVVNKPNVQPD